MPHVRHLDLTECAYLPELLSSLPTLCPQLETLRLGQHQRLTGQRRILQRNEQAAVEALLQSLPHLSPSEARECWEDEEQPEVRHPCHNLQRPI